MKSILSILLALCFLTAAAGCMKTPVETHPSTEESVFEEVSIPFSLLAQTLVDPRDFGAKGDGVTDDSQAITQAVKAAQEAGCGLALFAGEYRLEKNVQIPREISVMFEQGAVLAPVAESRLQFDGGIEAGDWQIFGGEGTLTGDPLAEMGNPLWFGAKGDGVTDDSKAISQALNMFREVRLPVTEKGYAVTSVSLTRQCRFGGRGGKVVLVATETAQDVLTISSSCVMVDNLSFVMTQAPEATCIYLDDSRAGFDRMDIDGIDTLDAFCVVRDAKHAKNMICTAHFNNFTCMDNRGTSFDLTDAWGFVFAKDILIDNSASKTKHGANGFTAIKVTDNAGIIMNNITVLGDPSSNARSHGVEINNSMAVWIEGLKVHNVGGCGLKNNGVFSYGYLKNHKYVGCGGIAVSIANSWYLQFSGIELDGLKADGTHSDKAGMQMSSPLMPMLYGISAKNFDTVPLSLRTVNAGVVSCVWAEGCSKNTLTLVAPTCTAVCTVAGGAEISGNSRGSGVVGHEQST
ncbi:MAG: hypothetical protein IKD06_03660 [Clostridia bacterium]|nr:hypothetical protein [Clostridia bacterium]